MEHIKNREAEILKRRLLRIKNSRQMNMADLSNLDHNSLLAISDALSILEQEISRLKRNVRNPRF